MRSLREGSAPWLCPIPVFEFFSDCGSLSGERSCPRTISALAEARHKIPALHYSGVAPQTRMYSILGISTFFCCVLKYSLPSVRNPGNLSQNSNILFRRCLGYSWCISKCSRQGNNKYPSPYHNYNLKPETVHAQC